MPIERDIDTIIDIEDVYYVLNKDLAEQAHPEQFGYDCYRINDTMRLSKHCAELLKYTQPQQVELEMLIAKIGAMTWALTWNRWVIHQVEALRFEKYTQRLLNPLIDVPTEVIKFIDVLVPNQKFKRRLYQQLASYQHSYNQITIPKLQLWVRILPHPWQYYTNNTWGANIRRTAQQMTDPQMRTFLNSIQFVDRSLNLLPAPIVTNNLWWTNVQRIITQGPKKGNSQ